MQRKLSRLLAPLGVAALFGALAGPVNAQTWIVTDITADIGSTTGHAYGFSQFGSTMVITGDALIGGNMQMVEWRYTVAGNGQLTFLSAQTFGATNPSVGNGASTLTNNGIYAGSETVSGKSHAVFENSNGPSLTDLGTLGTGSNSYGLAVNASKNVTGYSNTSGATTNHAFVTGGSASMTDIGTPGGYTQSAGYAIDSSGNVYASVTDAGGNIRGAVWTANSSNGTAGTWGTPFSAIGGETNVRGVNSAGTTVGFGSNGGAYHAFLRTSGGSVTDMGRLTGDAYGLGVNDLGQAVGYSGSSVYHAFYWNGSTMQDLENIELTGAGSGKEAPGHAGWVLNAATGINNSGYIIGYGTIGGQTHAFILTPSPVPAAPIVMLIGGAVFGLGMRRNRARREA